MEVASSTTKLAAAATETQLLSLTTPFVPPANRDCEINDLNFIVTKLLGDNTTISTSVIYSDPADTRFASCQPSGWDKVVPQSRFTFSPAVCPSQWIAHNIKISASAGKRVTTAYCCNPLYMTLDSLYTALGNETRQCIRSLNRRENITVLATLSDGQTRPMSTGLLQHPAWNIIWEASDQAMLTPRPPTIDSNTFISYWEPGTAIKTGEEPNGLRGLGDSLFWFLVIGLPLMFFAATGGGIWCCIRKSKRKRLLAAAAPPVGAPSVVDLK